MTLYKSSEHTIRAFQFKDKNYPDWFQDAVIRGDASVTINYKEQYITLYDHHGKRRHANPGEWVCINNQGTLFPLTEKEFIDSFNKCE